MSRASPCPPAASRRRASARAPPRPPPVSKKRQVYAVRTGGRKRAHAWAKGRRADRVASAGALGGAGGATRARARTRANARTQSHPPQVSTQRSVAQFLLELPQARNPFTASARLAECRVVPAVQVEPVVVKEQRVRADRIQEILHTRRRTRTNV
eukprot:6200279-Pleurochrysis_carterae.AAC.3